MYYEMRREQINWEEWKDERITVGGDLCWMAEGATLYKPTRDLHTRTIVRHRFALNPFKNTPRRRLRTDRYYVHVYQTRIGPERRTLRSRSIARELKRRFPSMW